MSDSDIARLREMCADFKKWRDLETDGNGNNLHDIKNSFDYVRDSLETYEISSTKFGSSLSAKAEAAGNVLSELWLIFQNLENAVTLFCDEQARNNGQGN